MSNRAELWLMFEESEPWKLLVRKLFEEHKKRISEVRANVKQSGKAIEAAYAAGCADTYELVSRLPSIIRKELAKSGEDNVNTSNA